LGLREYQVSEGFRHSDTTATPLRTGRIRNSMTNLGPLLEQEIRALRADWIGRDRRTAGRGVAAQSKQAQW
jgi:hypothetical protein